MREGPNFRKCGFMNIKKVEKVCFVIAPIGEADSDIRKRSDQVLKHIVRPAASSCEYKVLRADEIEKPGMITSQVIQHVVNEQLVIADLTGWNPNVFYELAIRHAIRKPVIQLINKGDRIPFDVAGSRTIYIDLHDLDSVETAKQEIITQVRALEADTTAIETPISVSLDLQLLRQSEKPEERSLADILASVSDLRTSVGKIEAKIGTQDGESVFDKIQSTLQALPRRFEEYAGDPLRRKRMRFHPMMFDELIHSSPDRSPTVGLFFIAGVFRDSMPWISEIIIEIARLVRATKNNEAMDLGRELQFIFENTTHGPMAREMFGDKESLMMLRDMERLLARLLDDLFSESSTKKRTRKNLAKEDE